MSPTRLSRESLDLPLTPVPPWNLVSSFRKTKPTVQLESTAKKVGCLNESCDRLFYVEIISLKTLLNFVPRSHSLRKAYSSLALLASR